MWFSPHESLHQQSKCRERHWDSLQELEMERNTILHFSIMVEENFFTSKIKLKFRAVLQSNILCPDLSFQWKVLAMAEVAVRLTARNHRRCHCQQWLPQQPAHWFERTQSISHLIQCGFESFASNCTFQKSQTQLQRKDCSMKQESNWGCWVHPPPYERDCSRGKLLLNNFVL